MGLSGTQHALTAARSGILRSGAGRSWWPILAGVRPPLYALSNVARSGATRSNFHSTKVFVSISGTQYATARAVDAQKILDGSLRITDTLNEAPTTATFRTKGFVPPEGGTVVITLGSINNMVRLFAGQILEREQSYVGTPANYGHEVSAIDYTWGLDKRKVSGHFTGSATTIAQSLIATYATAYTAVRVEAGLETVDGGITFTNEDLSTCLTRLAKRIGGHWYIDYYRDLHFFLSEPASLWTPPSTLNTVHPTLTEFKSRRDLSQWITRVYVEGGGAQALGGIAAGETIIPIENAEWFQASGGVLVSGPQRITYTGRSLGGGGSLVGPGAAPAAAAAVALASGAGIESGVHDYAVTVVTAAGESIAGPKATITVGVVAAPDAGPTLGTPTIGTGPDPGTHDYAVTFVTSAGETTAGPSATRATSVTPETKTPPTPGTPTVGTGPDEGVHEYAVTFVTSIGETNPSPVSAQVRTGPADNPSAGPSLGTGTQGTGPETGAHDYTVTFVNAAGETVAGPVITKAATDLTAAPSSAPTVGTGTQGTGPEAGSHDYAVTFVTASGETTAGPTVTKATTDLTAAPSSTPTVGVPTGGTGPDVGAHDYSVTFVTSSGETTPGPISAQATTSLLGPAAAATLGQGVSNEAGGSLIGTYGPWAVCFRVAGGGETEIVNVSNQITCNAPGQQVRFTDIAIGPTGTVSRVLYRLIGGQYKTITVIADNTTQGYVDNTADGSAGADAPVQVAGGTAYLRTVALTGIPTGPAQVTQRKLYRRFNAATNMKLVTTIANNSTTTYTDTTTNAGLGADAPTSNTATLNVLPLSNIPTGPSQVTARKVYRTAVGSAQLKLVGTIANNSTTTFSDTVADASLGANIPTSNTATLNVIPLTNIPIGGATVTQRKIYRTAVGSLQLKLLTTLANNSTTTYTDTTPDASLGANIPTTNTAAVNVVPLTGIARGDANVTARKLYRRSGGAGLKLVATIADNTTTTYSDTTANASLGADAPVSNAAYLQRIALSAIPVGGALVTQRKIYRTAAGGSQLKLLTTLADNTTTTFADTVTDASLGADAPASNTAAANQVALSGIPIGATGVTQRKVYRTVAGGAQLKLLTTIADNTTATYADSTADASLGANVPVTDTSGLAQPAGNVLAGSTSLLVAGTSAFSTSGGWAVIGNGQQVVRYTGISGTALTGIPASGAGAITATVAYNSTVTTAPQITGIPASGAGAIVYAILQGDDVNLLVQVDDTAAQTALAALIGGDGIQEDYLQDRRLAHAEATARGQAHLALRSTVEISLRYKTRDINVRAGQLQVVNLGAPTTVIGEFRIQQVTIANFYPALNPTYDVQASSTRFSFEDLLRLARKAGD